MATIMKTTFDKISTYMKNNWPFAFYLATIVIASFLFYEVTLSPLLTFIYGITWAGIGWFQIYKRGDSWV